VQSDKTVYRYSFVADVPMADVESSLILAGMAIESLHGEAEVRLDGGYILDEAKRVCVIDASTPLGRDLARIFVGFLAREFSSEAFSVERVEKHQAAPAAA
jgi:hypothetical protein